MPIARKHLPSPLMGEGSGGGGTRAFSPPSRPSPARGEGVFTSTCQALGADSGGGMALSSRSQTFPRQGEEA
jgi:hypothetical protein